MIKLLSKLLDNLKEKTPEVMLKFLSVIGKISDCINSFFIRSDNKSKIKQEKEKSKKIKNVCDNGTLEDLFDLDKFNKCLIVFISLILFVGCQHEKDIEIQSTKQWEGHYYTIEEFNKATKDIKLDKKESIWVLSNRSLNRVLQNIGNK